MLIASSTTLGACGSGETEIAVVEPAAGHLTTATEPPRNDPAMPAPPGADTIGAARHRGTDFRPVDVAQERPAISMERAVELAAKEFGYERIRPTEVSVGRVTVSSIGRKVDTGDPSDPIRIDPKYSDVLTWIIVYDRVGSYVGGPQAPEGETRSELPNSEIVSMMMHLDANTGAFMFADTFSREDANKATYGSEPLPTEKPRK